MDHKLVFENSCSAPVYTLHNTNYLFQGCKVLSVKTKKDLLNGPGT